VQLPIPPLGPERIRGNVPLAAGYLKLFAQNQCLEPFFDIQIFPTEDANTLGDQALVAALAKRDPWMVGFTCYVWNIERTLWIARELKKARPETRIVLGGPEITPDNDWVLETADYDFAVIGEGEQTFAELLSAILGGDVPAARIPGLYVPRSGAPAFRTPLPDLNLLGSPYLDGILDAADEQMLLLETTRGCVFKCKFCYYPKSYDGQYYLSRENILRNLWHACERGAREVFLLDPTMNQRKDFADFLRVLIEGNPGKRFSYFGELRGEGITEETAGLLREANFTEVEVGLQSIDPEAQKKMDRKNNLRAFERGVRTMMSYGIGVKVDLIIGLPGDTIESVRRGLHYLSDNGLYSNVQVFNLSILPGTAFRQEAPELGLRFQPRPPYYVLQTPTLRREDLYGLMLEAQDLFDIEFDAQPPPVLEFDLQRLPSPHPPCHPERSEGSGQQAEEILRCAQNDKGEWGRERVGVWHVDLDRAEQREAPDPKNWTQAFTLWFSSCNFERRRPEAAACIRRVLQVNPFTTLQVVLEPHPRSDHGAVQEILLPETLAFLFAACQARPTYLDRYYALQPGRPNGAKRLIVVLPMQARSKLNPDWLEEVGSLATIVWRRPPLAPRGKERTRRNTDRADERCSDPR
jgi:radical SAM superfamily enzyme YgiQ (UPF0313 family)